MMIHYDQLCFLRALVHGGDKAAAEVRAFLAGAEVAARINSMPEVGIVRQKRQFAAVAGFSKFSPIANLRKPIDLVDALQYSLALHLIHFCAAKKIVATFHQRGFQIGREMFLQKRDILIEELFLKRFRRGGNYHAPAAANGGNQVSQCLACSSSGLDNGMLLSLKSFIDHPGHFELRRTKLVTGMTLFE